MRKAVEHNDARPPKKGLFQGARHSPSTFRPLIGRDQEERTSMRSAPTGRSRSLYARAPDFAASRGEAPSLPALPVAEAFAAARAAA